MRRKHLHFLFASLIVIISILIVWSPSQAEEEDSTAYFGLTYGEPADLYLGKAGVYMVSSSYNATATMNRFVPGELYPAEGLEFYDRWLDFGIYDYYGNPYRGLWGFNYAYFNLKYHTRRLWDEGELSIFRWDSVRKEWIECPTYLVELKNLPHGRLTCVMTAFGTYGIASEK
jgi:hypothetical protein